MVRGSVSSANAKADCPRIAASHAVSIHQADALTAHGIRGEKIRKVTSRRNLNRAAMIKKMRETDDPAGDLRHQRVHGLVGIKKARPGHPADLWRQRGFAGAAIERIVAFPKLTPLGKIGALHGAYVDRFAQRRPPTVLTAIWHRRSFAPLVR